MEKEAKIYVAGHRGLVGSALVRALSRQGYANLVVKTHVELDLLNQQAVADFFDKNKPDYVFMAAAKVGGINANNTSPADFIYKNLEIQNNIIHQAYLNKVKKLLFLGSVCIYPKFAPEPVAERSLLTGLLEPTNEPYAIAKIAGIKLCQSYNRQYGTNFVSVMPTNLYGPYDNFDLQTSHVLPALIRKFHEAKINNQPEVVAWGTGTPRREFMHSDDMAEACLFVMDHFNPTKEENEAGDILLNLGVGSDLTIKELVQTIKDIVGYQGKVVWDQSKPDGTPGRLLDSSRIWQLGWHHKIELTEGIKAVYKWFLDNNH